MAKKKAAPATESSAALVRVREEYLGLMAGVSQLPDHELGDLRERVRTAHRDLDADRKTTKAPHLEVCRGIDDEYRPVLDTLTQALRMVDDQILARANARKVQIQELATAAPSSPPADTHAALTAVLAAPEVPGQVRLRTDYGYEIDDITLIPGEYWCLDESKLLAAIKASCGTVQIPGVRVVRTSKVVTR